MKIFFFFALILTLLTNQALAEVDKKKALEECGKGISLKSGERASFDQRKLIRACLEKKGIKKEGPNYKRRDERKASKKNPKKYSKP